MSECDLNKAIPAAGWKREHYLLFDSKLHHLVVNLSSGDDRTIGTDGAHSLLYTVACVSLSLKSSPDEFDCTREIFHKKRGYVNFPVSFK